MKDIFVIFAKANEDSDKAFVSILDKMDNIDREKNRKSYYGSLSGLARHAAGGTFYFLSMFAESVASNAAASKALAQLAKLDFSNTKKLDEAGWKKFAASLKTLDRIYVEFVSALEEKDFAAPVKINWYKGKPEAVPLSFMLQQLVSHGTHHRGQISQILDSLKIDNDYSGINVKFLK